MRKHMHLLLRGSFRRNMWCSRRSMSYETETVKLCYTTYEQTKDGNATKTPMIILHGMMGSRNNWHSLSHVFSTDSQRKIITVDARNHGQSPHTEDINYFLMRDDVLRVMDRENLEDAVLLGHSMGGKTAMTTALTYPERVSSLFVVDAAPRVTPHGTITPLYLQTMLKLSLRFVGMPASIPLSQARETVVHVLEEVGLDKEISQFLAMNLDLVGHRFKWTVNIDSIINNIRHLASFPKLVGETFHGPSFFIGGADSPYITDKEVPLIKTYFPLVVVEHIPGAGHWVHSDKPYLFIDSVNTFLAQLDS